MHPIKPRIKIWYRSEHRLWFQCCHGSICGYGVTPNAAYINYKHAMTDAQDERDFLLRCAQENNK